MKAQGILPQYEAVVAEYDVKFLLCYYLDIDSAVEDIVLCIAKHTSPKWAAGVSRDIKDIVRGVAVDDPAYKAGGRAAELSFVFDKDFFLGYDPERGVVLRRRA